MKAVINGKRYNTATAVQVGERESRADRGAAHWFYEGLYRTPRGGWFLHGRGGALSPYSREEGTSRGPGEAIRPVSAAAARDWLECEEALDALEEHFGEELSDA